MADITLHKDYLEHFKTCNSQNKSIQLVVSDELKGLLRKVTTNNKFVKRLLSPIKIKAAYIVPNNANYLDINSDDNGNIMISYYTIDQLNKVLRIKHGRSVETMCLPVAYLMDTRRNYPREVTTPGRILGKIFDSVNNKEVEEFSTIFKSLNLDDSVTDLFREVVGDKISYYYNEHAYSNTDSEASTLHKSCMRYSTLNVFMDMYAKNPETISLLVLPDDKGRIKGRAIVWKNGDKKYIDRIYYDSYSTYTMFVKYCRIKGIQNISERNSSFNLIPNRDSFKVQLQNWKLQYYPYTDTLNWLEMKTGILHMALPEIKLSKMSDYLFKALPDEHKNNPTVIQKTKELIEEAVERGYVRNNTYLSDEDLVFFNIQSTGGKGNNIKKYTKRGEPLCWLNSYYSAYLPEKAIQKNLINSQASPIWNCRKVLNIITGEVVNIDLVLNASTKEYVHPTVIEDSVDNGCLCYKGITTHPTTQYFSSQSTIIAKEEDCVYNRAFHYPLLKSQCIKMDEEDDLSWIPELLYKNNTARPLYDAVYQKVKNNKEFTADESLEFTWLLFRLFIGDAILQMQGITKATLKTGLVIEKIALTRVHGSNLMPNIQSVISNNTMYLARASGTKFEQKTLLSNYVHLTFLLQNATVTPTEVSRMDVGGWGIRVSTALLDLLDINRNRINVTSL